MPIHANDTENWSNRSVRGWPRIIPFNGLRLSRSAGAAFKWLPAAGNHLLFESFCYDWIFLSFVIKNLTKAVAGFREVFSLESLAKKPPAKLVEKESLDTRKSSFDKTSVGLANRTKNQRRTLSMTDIKSLSHSKWN